MYYDKVTRLFVSLANIFLFYFEYKMLFSVVVSNKLTK